jgi:AraC family transcriptional regulator
LAKIADELEQALERRAREGRPGSTDGRLIAQGSGWSVRDVLCTSGPRDRVFEERHSMMSIAIVLAGSFQYRSTPGCELMTPGAVLLGNTGQTFECSHQHGEGDRCIAFTYNPEFFERIASDSGVRGRSADFRPLRLPPLTATSSIVAQACAGLIDSVNTSWEELCIELAARATQLAAGITPSASSAPPGATARVTRTVRMIESRPSADHKLDELADIAGLSSYHFLRTFEGLTGVTPHQYVVRTRMRYAAVRLTSERGRIIDIALDSGFGDISNFNRTFRAEFGVTPRAYRKLTQV